MAEAAPRDMTVDEFFAWQEGREERYELVDGQPQCLDGVTRLHDRIVVNLIAELSTRLRCSGCAPFTRLSGLETPAGQIRRPDVGIDCGERDPNGYTATEPRVVFEVLSPSTRDFDTIRKLDEYKAIPSVHTVLLIDPDSPSVVVWRRSGDPWRSEIVSDLDAAIGIEGPDLALPLAAIYEDVAFTSPSERVCA